VNVIRKALGIFAALVAGVVALDLAAHAGDEAEAEEALKGEEEHASPRPVSEADLREGRPIYVRECSACHGERGDGKGPASAFLDPKPRDFTAGLFKLRSTPAGSPPRTEDVLHTLERGIPGTAMPSFAFLPEAQRRLVGAVVLNFADQLESPEPDALPDPGAAPPATPELLARGKEVYELMQCGSCHGKLGRGDGPSAKTLRDDAGNFIKVRDFTTGIFRGGGGPRDLYDRFVTGMDGTPMPAYGDSVVGEDRWALVHHVLSLRVTPAPAPLPQDPIKAGRAVAVKYGCRGCHVLDDGKGGEVGPDLRVSGQKLGSDWVRAFVAAPRDVGKIYPWRPWRMPHLGLSEDECAAVTRYLAAMGRRKEAPAEVPDPATFAAARVEEGKNLYLLRCTECHNLGTVIETPPAKQQGPDLIRVAGRVDYAWARKWIIDPKKIDPKTKMTVPGLTPEQVDSVRMFVWKTSLDAEVPDRRCPLDPSCSARR
jgi:cytochrome c oxidase cbb3-type subunit 2